MWNSWIYWLSVEDMPGPCVSVVAWSKSALAGEAKNSWKELENELDDDMMADGRVLKAICCTVQEEEKVRVAVVQQIVAGSTAFLRSIFVQEKAQGGVTLTYVCPHCKCPPWRTTFGWVFQAREFQTGKAGHLVVRIVRWQTKLARCHSHLESSRQGGPAGSASVQGACAAAGSVRLDCLHAGIEWEYPAERAADACADDLRRSTRIQPEDAF